MALRRGSAYEPPPGSHPDTDSVLVVSDDDWNRMMSTSAVIPLRPPGPNTYGPLVVAVPALHALFGNVALVREQELGNEIRQLDAAELQAVEDQILDLVAAEPLLSNPARLPNAPGGAITYPRWGEIYYAGPRIGGEHKRFVVISDDFWNVRAGVHVAVRLTSQHKYPDRTFPEVGGGRACCGDAASLSTTECDMRGRPNPLRLNLDEMVDVLVGFVETHGLESAVIRAGLSLP